MRRLAGVLTIVTGLLAGALPAPAGAAMRHWRLTATVSGGYTNQVTSSEGCPAQFAETVRGLRATAAGRLDYDPQVHVLAGTLRLRVTGGRWRVTGSYAAATTAADGTPGCAPTPTPVDCAAGVIADDGLRVSARVPIRLLADTNRRGHVVSRFDAPRLTERYADTKHAPKGWPAACHVIAPDDSVPVTPLFGLADTDLAQRTLAAPLAFPQRRLAGHRSFALSLRSAPTTGCADTTFDTCTESSTLRLRVRLTPARR